MVFRLKTWVLLASSLVMVPIIVVMLVGFLYVQQLERSKVEAELRYHVADFVHATNERLAVSVQALRMLSNSEAAQTRDWPALLENARRVLQTNPSFTAITLLDRNNQLLFVTSIPYGQQAFNNSYTELVQEVFQTSQPNVSGPFKTPTSDFHLVAVSVPVVHGGEVTHVLRMILRTVVIDQVMKEQQFPSGWLVSIADRKGTIVARSLDAEQFVGKAASATFRAAIERKDDNLYRGRSAEGISITALAMPIFNNYWFAAVGVPDDVLESVYRQHLLYLAAAIGLTSLFGGVVALWISRFLARQAQALEQVVHGGRPNNPLPWRLRVTELVGIYDSYRDFSAREQAAQGHLKTVTLERDEVEDLYNHAPCGYHSLDARGVVVRINQTELTWLRLTREQVVGQPFVRFMTEASRKTFEANYPKFLAQGHVENLEFELCRSDGSTFNVAVNATLVRDEQGTPVVSRNTVFDITERKKLEDRLQALSNCDPLTGLPNRRYFYEVAEKEIVRSQRYHAPLTVPMLDVDHFKKVNDVHGHQMGDLLLKTLASICRTSLRETDVIARIGGEEFAILMLETGTDDAVPVLERLREALERQQITSDKNVCMTFTVSIGIAALKTDETSMDPALKRADAALYEVKQHGRNQVRVAS